MRWKKNGHLGESLCVEVTPLPVCAPLFNTELTFRIWQVTTQAAMTEAFTSLEKATKDITCLLIKKRSNTE